MPLELISLIRLISLQNDTSKKLCLFLGAGTDIASGGVLFSDLKKNCLQYQGVSLPSNPSQFAIDETFDTYFQSVSEEERCIILEKLLREERGLHPSDGYKLLVLLARERIVSSVVTTNFDNLLENAASEMGLDTFQVVAPGISHPAKRNPSKTIYLKMHGDIDGHLVTHLTSDEINTKEYQREYKDILKYFLLHNTVIISGYSGYDTKIADIFAEVVDQIPTVYWCNPSPPKSEAPLVKVLSDANKIQYLSNGFDDTMEMIAGEVFRDRTIFHANSIFIWSLIKTKIKKIQKNFLKHIPPQLLTTAVARAKVSTEYHQYILQKKYNLFVLSGQQGTGKTTFIAQIINQNESDGLYVIPLTAPGTLMPEASTYLLENLGYVTSTPISVIYEMAEWMKDRGHNIVFTFDGIGDNGISETQIAQYISTIIEVAYILRHISNVKFLISIRNDNWERAKSYLDDNYLREIMWNSGTGYNISTCQIGPFSRDELFMALQHGGPDVIHYKEFEGLSEEVLTLLCEPFFCGLALQDPKSLERLTTLGQIGLVSTLDRFLSNENLTFIDKQHLQGIAYAMLQNNSSKIPLKTCYTELTMSGKRFLEQSGGYISFRHPLYWKYYLVRHYQTNNIIEKISHIELKKIIKVFFDDNVLLPVRESFVLYLSSPDLNIDKVFIFLSELLNYASQNTTGSIRINHLVNEVLHNLAGCCPEKVLDWIHYVNQSSTAFCTLSQRIALSTTYMNDESAYPVLRQLYLSRPNPVALECFVLINDRFTYHLRHLELGKERDYIEKYVFALRTHNPLVNVVQLIWLMGRIGVDNVDEKKYTQIATAVKQQLGAFLNTNTTKGINEEFKEGFLLNAYMIFFNANDDLEEKYYCHSANSEVSPIIKKLISEQSGLTADQLDTIRSCINRFDEPIDFFICNLLFIESAIQNPSRAEGELLAFYNKLGGTANVVELDFYLSALFLSQYVINPKCRQFYLSQFKRTVNDYETVLFTSPANERAASRHRFSDMLDLEFEDGFNALTNYSYTAPSTYLDTSSRTVEEYLEIYWTLLNTLEQTGSYKEIVRLLQAVNQMIVNWPTEGFDALRKFLPTQHPIIHQALIKILSQNYLRYPQVTKQFIDDMEEELSTDELQQIYGSTDSHIQYRTLEQLQWARIIYYIRTWIDPNIVKHVLSIFLHTDTLETALVKIVTLLINPNNGEIAY